MSKSRFTPEELRAFRKLASAWGKIVSKRAFGESGPGLDVDFRTMADLAQAVAEGVTEGTLQTLLEQQAQPLEKEPPCPACGRLCRTQPQKRPLVARGIELEQVEPVAYCPDGRRDFFPLRIPLGLDEHGDSSSVLQEIVTASARFHSFRDTTYAAHMARIPVRESQLRRLAHLVGEEMIDQRDRQVLAYRQRKLPSRTPIIPSVVAVEVDGGRIRTRQANTQRGVHEQQNKEDQIACLVTLESKGFADDPSPEPPETFQEPRRVQRLVQPMKGQAGEANSQEILEESEDRAARLAEIQAIERWSPKRLVRTCVASLATSQSFGPMMAAEAQERHFYEALRRAFVADGSAYNWSIHQGYFRDFVPIVDFLHVRCYVYSAARAVSPEEASGWSPYLVWMRSCWQGRVAEVMAELEIWQGRLGLPPRGEPQTAAERRDPRPLVAEARTYLTNNQERMDDPRYRREGLPTTSSLVESLVGEFNTRVKSKQQYWNRPSGAESILQLRAALLSEDDRLTRHFANRPGNPFRKKRPAEPESTSTTAQTAA